MVTCAYNSVVFRVPVHTAH